MGMGVFGVVAVGASLYFVWKERVGIIKEDQFSFKDTKWNFVALFLFALSCVLMTLVNAEDFWATLQGKVKTIIDWRHIAVFPAMTAAALFEVGFTSKKVLSVANEMTEKALIDKELQTAQEFQRQTLPPMRFENDLWRWRAVYKSASKLGGDWFDVREITFPNGKRMLVIGLVDVTGHGVGAAMVTTIVAAIWGLWCKDMSTKNTPESPEDNVAFLKEACGRLQEALSASRKEASGTGAFALLCVETQTLTYCTVGHPAIVVTNNKTISSLVTGNAAFGHATQGQERDWKIENKKISPEEKVIFYSDGIVPAESDASGFVQGFRRRLKKETLNVPTEFFQALRKARQSFRQNRDIEDDVTALVVGLK
jgi:serine phosphatase RsbU (regulator of sigma subunit)